MACGRPTLRHSSLAGGGAAAATSAQPRHGCECQATHPLSVDCKVFCDREIEGKGGRDSRGDGDGQNGDKRKRPGRLTARVTLPSRRRALLGALVLAYHCALLWLVRRGGGSGSHPFPPDAHMWDNGPGCVEGGESLKPGWVCTRRTEVRRLAEDVPPGEFLVQYYRPGMPVVLGDLGVRKWHVFRNNGWAVDKLLTRFGHLKVDLQVGRSKDADYIRNGHRLQQRIGWAEFLRMLTSHRRESNDYYLTANNYLFRQKGFKSMLRDIKPLYAGFMDEEDPDDPAVGVDIWMGPKGTVSPLHQDATSIFFTQVAGRKLWRLISPDQRGLLYTKDGISEVNLERPWEDIVQEFPRMSEAVILTVVLEPGQTLFLPNGWWHHVTSLDSPCISVSSSRWLPMFHEAERLLHTKWSEYPWEVHLWG